jgi:Rrf2 family protein
MKLSTRGRYSLKMMVDVARNGGESEPVSLASISRRTKISHGYLEQLALTLRGAGLVRGVAGRRGGYRLTRPARDIRVRQIIEAALGPVCIVDCLEEPRSCPTAQDCECRAVFELINHCINEVLDEYSLADLADPDWQRSIGSRHTRNVVSIGRQF